MFSCKVYRWLLTVCLWIACIAEVMSQLPHDFRSEQVFLGVARTEWAMNDTIEADGIVTCLSNGNLLPYSQYVYVELLNGDDSVLVRQKYSCKDGGAFHAMVPTAAVLNDGVCYLRAYTSLMRSFSNKSFVLQPLLVGKSFPRRGNVVHRDVVCRLFPDGGFLVKNHIQGVTVALSDNGGGSLDSMTVCLVDDSGDTVSTGRTHEAGVANLKFIPQDGRSYSVLVGEKGECGSFCVPQAFDDRVKLQCFVNGNKIRFELLNVKGDLSDYQLYFYNKENGLKRVEPLRKSGVVLLEKMPWITTAFLADSMGNVLSECTSVSRYSLPEAVQLPDTVASDEVTVLSEKLAPAGGKAFVRLVTEKDSWIPFAESQLQYLSDYESPLPFPSGFFKENHSSRATDLQAWLNTATFKRFRLCDAIAKDTLMYSYTPEMNMTICGSVRTEDRTVFRGGTLIAYNTSNNLVYDAPISNDGLFRMAVDDFSEGTTFFLQAVDKHRKPVGAYIDVDIDSFLAVACHDNYEAAQQYAESTITIYGGIKGRILPNVEVKARVRHDEPVARSKFYDERYADREKIEEHDWQTLADILKGMPSLQVVRGEAAEANTWKIGLRRGTIMGNGMVILLDGIRIDYSQYDVVLNMSAFDIESVEVLSAWKALAYTWGSVEGAVLVTTRKASGPKKVRSKGTYYTPMGLSVGRMPGRKPVAPGNYRLLVDVVSPGGVTSYERDIVVKK